MKSRKSHDVSIEPMACSSSSNCEYAFSGKPNSSSRSSFGSAGTSAGEVGGVENGFECVDDRDGVDAVFNGLDVHGAFTLCTDPDDCGRWFAGD